MSGHAALYAPTPGLPSLDAVRALVPTATVSASNDARSGAGARLVIEWPDLRLVLGALPADKLALRLQGLLTHVQQTCQTREPALLARIAGMQQGLTLLVEPGFDEVGRARGFLLALAARLQGLSFIEGAVYSPQGACLASPAGQPSLEAPPLERPANPGSPTAARVARRALVLGAVAARVSLEGDTGADREERRRWLLGRMKELGLTGEWEPEEQRLLETPAGKLSREQAIESSWRSEGLVVLAWALGLGEVPPHDSLAETWELLIHGMKLLDVGMPPVLGAPRLRPLEELRRMEHRLQALHGRLRAFLQTPQASGPVDLQGIALVEGDLAIDGVPLARAPEARVWECQSIALERHQAIHWLLGQEPVYSRVETPT